MTTPSGIVEDGADFVRLALDCLCEGLQEVEDALTGTEVGSEAQSDAPQPKWRSGLVPDVEGHPC